MITATCACGKTYRAKPELAGRRVRCRTCSETFLVPAVDEPIVAEVSQTPNVTPAEDMGAKDAAPTLGATVNASVAKDWTPPEPASSELPPVSIPSPRTSDTPSAQPPDRKFGGALVILLVVGAAVLLPVICLVGGLAMVFLTLANDFVTTGSPSQFEPAGIVQEIEDPASYQGINDDIAETFDEPDPFNQPTTNNAPQPANAAGSLTSAETRVKAQTGPANFETATPQQSGQSKAPTVAENKKTESFSWSEHLSRSKLFSISMPGDPDVTEIYGTQTETANVALGATGEFVAIEEQMEPGLEVQRALDEYLARLTSENNAERRHRGRRMINGHTRLDFVLERKSRDATAGNSTIWQGRLFVFDDKICHLQWRGPQSQAQSATVNQFFRSLKLLPENVPSAISGASSPIPFSEWFAKSSRPGGTGFGQAPFGQPPFVPTGGFDAESARKRTVFARWHQLQYFNDHHEKRATSRLAS